jgi:hypothetical protein
MTIQEALKALEQSVNQRHKDATLLEMIYNAACIVANETTNAEEGKKIDRLIFQLEIQLKNAQRSYKIASEIDRSEEVLKDIIRWSKSKQSQNEKKLTATEVALRHLYLVKGKKEKYLIPRQVGEKYKHLASAKNIEMAYSKVDKVGYIPKLKQLMNIKKTLEEYPEIMKAIDNDMNNRSTTT